MAHPKKDDRSQVKAFRKAARELGADESEARFDTALKMVARHKPANTAAKERKPQRKR